jgi:site-specific recombinase XerD
LTRKLFRLPSVSRPAFAGFEPLHQACRRHPLQQLFRARISDHGLGPDDLLFATGERTPISRNTFRTRVWFPAIRASCLDFNVRIHDLCHAHASWLRAGGADLKSVMDRMGHTQIQTNQKYLHALPDADQKNLTALDRIRSLAVSV